MPPPNVTTGRSRFQSRSITSICTCPAGEVAEAKAWYAKMFDGVPGKRSNYDAVDLPGINLNFSEGPRPTVPTKGRMLDHIGFEIQDLQAFCRRLESLGVQFDAALREGRGGRCERTADRSVGNVDRVDRGSQGRVTRVHSEVVTCASNFCGQA